MCLWFSRKKLESLQKGSRLSRTRFMRGLGAIGQTFCARLERLERNQNDALALGQQRFDIRIKVELFQRMLMAVSVFALFTQVIIATFGAMKSDSGNSIGACFVGEE